MEKVNGTICWQCANANALGCEWFRAHKPVKGWNAMRNDIKIHNGTTSRTTESYVVVGCPLFTESRLRKAANE